MTQTAFLSPAHKKILQEGSGISAEVIAERGYRTITSEEQLMSLPAFRRIQARIPGILMPCHTISGEEGRYMYRPDNPRTKEEDTKERQPDGAYLKKNTVIKYESQPDMPPVIDCPPRCRKDIDDPSVPLYITEGQKKADAMASRGLCAISLQGVYNFKGTNSKGGKTLLPDFDRIAWNGRAVRIVYDSDIVSKPQVKMAMEALAAHAEKKDAREVARVVLPALSDGSKCGVDDYFRSGHTAQDLEALAQMATLQAEAHKKPAAPLVADDGAHDEGNAQFAANLMGDGFLHVTEIGWLNYTGTHWRGGDADKFADRAIVEALKTRRAESVNNPGPYSEAIIKAARPTAKNVSNTRTLLSSILTAGINSFDDSPDVLNVANGVVDLRTGKLIPHHETRHRFTYCSPVEYHPDSPHMKTVFGYYSEAVKGGKEVATFLFRMLGYGITGHTRLEKFLYIYGKPRAGKGTLIEMLTETFPTLVGVTTFATLTQRAQDVNDFRLAELRPCRIVIADEGANKMQFDADRIKYLTGGAPVQCAFKHKRAFTYKPQFMPILVSNNPLQMDVDDEAAWSRPRIVEFPHSHVADEDPSIKAQLKSKEALEGLLALMVWGARDFYASGMKSIPTPDTVTLSAIAHRAEADYVQQWIDECCTMSDDPQKPTLDRSQVHGNYAAWCLQAGQKAWGGRRFYQALRGKGFDVSEGVERHPENGRVGRYVRGLILTPDTRTPKTEVTL